MKDYYHGCTGGLFGSPVHWSDIYGWQYAYTYNPSEWSDYDSESVENFQWIREPSDQYWIIPHADKKKESDISCFSCLFGTSQPFFFKKPEKVTGKK